MISRVPPPPEPERRPLAPKTRPKLRLAAPLDVGFLGRVYVSTLWLGLIWTACAWGVTQSARATGSFAAGVILGALLLKSQEIFVSRVLVPRGDVGSELLRRVPIAVLLPLKYVAIAIGFGLFISLGWLEPLALAAGFLTEQVVIFSKIIGHFISNGMRSRSSEQEKLDQNKQVAQNQVGQDNKKSHVAF